MKISHQVTDVLDAIQQGTPFSYPAATDKNRKYTISLAAGTTCKYALTCNQLKKIEILTDVQAAIIIGNVLFEQYN